MHRPWRFFQVKRQLADSRRFVNLLLEIRPDMVNWGSLNGLAMNLLPLPMAVHIPDVHWIEHPWMTDEYGAAGEKVAPFWESVWDGILGPRPFQPLLRWLGRLRNLLIELVTNAAALDQIALRGQAVTQTECRFDVMMPRWEATIARVPTPYAYAQGESR